MQHSPLSFSQSVEVELEVVFYLSGGVNEDIEAGGEGDMVADGAEVVLDVVHLLLVLINDLVSVEHHVPTEQSRKSSSKPKTETTVEGLGILSCHVKNTIYLGLYFDEEDQGAGQAKPLIEGLVGHVAGGVLVQRLGEGKVGGREGEVEVVESVEAEEEQGGAVYSQAEAVVERVAAG